MVNAKVSEDHTAARNQVLTLTKEAVYPSETLVPTNTLQRVNATIRN
jgi:hypothetical protein